MNEKMSNLLRSLRAGKNMSLSDVGEKVGYHRATIQKWESNPMKTDFFKIMLLLDLYEVEIEYFFYTLCDNMPQRRGTI